jgi:hypothetical protein
MRSWYAIFAPPLILLPLLQVASLTTVRLRLRLRSNANFSPELARWHRAAWPGGAPPSAAASGYGGSFASQRSSLRLSSVSHANMNSGGGGGKEGGGGAMFPLYLSGAGVDSSGNSTSGVEDTGVHTSRSGTARNLTAANGVVARRSAMGGGGGGGGGRSRRQDAESDSVLVVRCLRLAAAPASTCCRSWNQIYACSCQLLLCFVDWWGMKAWWGMKGQLTRRGTGQVNRASQPSLPDHYFD